LAGKTKHKEEYTMSTGSSITKDFYAGTPNSPWPPVDDWTSLIGLNVRIYDRDRFFDAGRVDAVTVDGRVLWLNQDGATPRRIVEKLQGRYVQVLP
jgi:hypothetical protein